jgi:hypothetical protein
LGTLLSAEIGALDLYQLDGIELSLTPNLSHAKPIPFYTLHRCHTTAFVPWSKIEKSALNHFFEEI